MLVSLFGLALLLTLYIGLTLPMVTAVLPDVFSQPMMQIVLGIAFLFLPAILTRLSRYSIVLGLSAAGYAVAETLG